MHLRPPGRPSLEYDELVPVRPLLCLIACSCVSLQGAPREFSVDRYGAKGDGRSLATAAIQKAIDAAATSGGAVVFPPGNYVSGALFLKSGVEFRLAAGVVLHAVEDDSQYPIRPSRIGGIEMSWPVALLNVIDQSRVRITGKGTIDGHGPFWWHKFWGADQKSGMLRDYVARGVRWAVDYDCQRIRPILIQNSRNIEVRDLTIRRSGFWTLTATYSQHVTIAGLVIRANEGGQGPSTDGIDIDSSSHILIEDCDIECNDDNICLKSGRDADGLRVNRPTTDVVIRNCITRAGHGMVTIGSDMSGGVRNVEVYGIRAIGTKAGIRFKSARVRGGLVENIRFHDITMEAVPVPFEFNLDWFPAFSYPKLPASFNGKPIPAHWIAMTRAIEPPERGIPEFRDIDIARVTATGAQRAFAVAAHPEKPIRNLRWTDISVSSEMAGSIRHAADWTIHNFKLSTTSPHPLALEDCRNVPLPPR
ncbi:MAG: glycoside hydrolase family 28 protein [Acidobacteria bacterium]|nr:glycoside hydrolase family 28 protein [Acidobacteriota bacterium]